MEEPGTLQPNSTSQRQVLEEAVSSYQFELAMAPAAQAYLRRRGLSRQTVDGARLGVVSDDPWPGHYGKTGWLCIPYLDRFGRPLTVRFRCLEHEDCKAAGHRQKYMSVHEDPARTYNLKAVHAAACGERGDSAIHVCEGELDALILDQAGLHAIAIPGAAGWSLRHRKILAGFNDIHVWADGDDAGDKFARKVTRTMHQATVVRLPRDTDVTEVYLKHGYEGLMTLLKGEQL